MQLGLLAMVEIGVTTETATTTETETEADTEADTETTTSTDACCGHTGSIRFGSNTLAAKGGGAEPGWPKLRCQRASSMPLYEGEAGDKHTYLTSGGLTYLCTYAFICSFRAACAFAY